MFEWNSSGKVGDWKAVCNFGRNWEMGDLKCGQSIEFVKGGGDRRNIHEKLEGFCWGVVEGSSDLDEGPVLDLFQLLNELLFGVLGVEPELGSVGDGQNDHRFVEKVEVGRRDSFNGVAEHS